MQKYGFVYLWYDRKHKRFYIGCHWGTEDDEYICSSSWMRQGYKHRPQDFKRRILSLVFTNRTDLMEEEYRWLSMIKDGELGKRYYNVQNFHHGHWSTDEASSLTVRQKMSLAKLGKKRKPHTQETKNKMRLTKLGKKQTEEHNKNQSTVRMGKKRKPHTLETLEKMRRAWDRRKARNKELEVILNLNYTYTPAATAVS